MSCVLGGDALQYYLDHHHKVIIEPLTQLQQNETVLSRYWKVFRCRVGNQRNDCGLKSQSDYEFTLDCLILCELERVSKGREKLFLALAMCQCLPLVADGLDSLAFLVGVKVELCKELYEPSLDLSHDS